MLYVFHSRERASHAKADWRAFWVAADTHERVNGRTYTELQIALPRELGDAQRKELAMEATREFLGDRFAYTLAIHSPVAKDKIEQPHLHLMFSERVIDETTKALPEDKFFKRNGAKKDRETWHDRSKPEEVRIKWCEMMNRAMEREGIVARVDPRSWADQGRDDLDALKEPKMLGGDGGEAKERRKEITELRERRNELPEMHLEGAAALQQMEAEAEAEIVAIETNLEEELGIIDRMIAKAKEAIEKLSQHLKNVFGVVPLPVVARVAPHNHEKAAQTQHEHWLRMVGAEAIAQYEKNASDLAVAQKYFTQDQNDQHSLRQLIDLHESQKKWWEKAFMENGQHEHYKKELTRIQQQESKHPPIIADLQPKVDAYEKQRQDAYNQFDNQIIRVRLNPEQAKLMEQWQKAEPFWYRKTREVKLENQPDGTVVAMLRQADKPTLDGNFWEHQRHVELEKEERRERARRQVKRTTDRQPGSVRDIERH